MSHIKEANNMQYDENELIEAIIEVDDGDSGWAGNSKQDNKRKHAEMDEVEVTTLDKNENVGGGRYRELDEGIRGSSSLRPLSLPREKAGPTPFLLKIFDMVTDPDTNNIISWNHSGTSLIIWDSFTFCEKVLPRYFKHKNFPSFIYQLNNYGFKKICWDHQWEYCNKWFQAGEKHLLKNIERRSQLQLKSAKATFNASEFGMERGLKRLKEEQNELRMEVLELQQQQEDIKAHLVTIKQKMQNSKDKQRQMFLMMAKNLDSIFNYVIQQLKKKLIADDETIKRPRRDPESIVSHDNEGRLLAQVEEEETTTQLGREMSCDDSGTNAVRAQEGTSANLYINSEYIAMLEKALMHDLNCESEDGGDIMMPYSKMFTELGDLIGSAADQGQWQPEK